jgi:ABC-type nitrate/sulfonate/bicarbonate transport system substrate-binding protein
LSEVRLVDIPIGRGHFDDAPVGGKRGEALWNALSIRTHQREELFALIRGEVDAMFAESAFGIDAALFLGAHVVYDVRRHPDQRVHSNNAIPHTLTVSGRLLEERPDLVARVLAQVLRAASWARSHHEDAVRFVAAESGSAEETVELAYGPALSEQFDVNLSPENLEAIRERKEFLLGHGVIHSDFALEDWIDRRPLEEAQRILAQREELQPAARTHAASAATTLA